MANVALQTIAKPSKSSTDYTYNDLHLDVEYTYTRNSQFLKENEVKDIVSDHDYAAIKNSIYNLFLTLPGQKILNPTFGINLMQYLFRPCDAITANQIAKDIFNGITRFEPRVNVILVDVIALNGTSQLGPGYDPFVSPIRKAQLQGGIPDSNTYQVNLTISVPQVGSGSFNLVGTLSNSGFYFNN